MHPMSNDRKRLAAIAAKVAKTWGVEAPFPKTTITDRWLKHKGRMRLVELDRRDLETDRRNGVSPRRIKLTEERIARNLSRAERLTVPDPYLSWDHIAAFHDMKLTKEESDALVRRR
jgi:hypothetical protein